MPDQTSENAPEPKPGADKTPETPANANNGATKPPKKRGPVFWVVMTILCAAGAIWLIGFIHHAIFYEETDDAYVEGHVHMVSARIGGDVTEVLVDDNQQVREGQVLAKIDPQEYEISLQRAQAGLAQAQAQSAQSGAAVEQAQADLDQSRAASLQAQAQVDQSQAQLDVSGENFNRNKRLYGDDAHAVAKADLDTTQGNYKADDAGLVAAKANLTAVQSKGRAAEAGLSSARAQQASSVAAVAASETQVRDAQRLLSYATITAIADGYIGNKNIETGNRVQIGQSLFALIEPSVWVVANFKETQVGKMHKNQPVEMTIDTFGDRTFHGRVESVSPATGAQFALLPADNATGNFTKVVQRVPVKIVFDQDSTRDVLDRIHPGLSTVVNVRVK